MSLVAHWKLDGDAKDSVGGNDGSISGASTTSGKLGDALDFDGSGDGVDVGSRRFSASSWSITMWIKPAQVSKLQHLTGVYGADFGDWSPLSHFAINDSKATWWDPDSGWKYGNTTLSNGSWYFICLVGNTDEENVTTYVNGEQDRKVTSTIKNNIGVLDVLGYRGHGNDRYFNGKIDDVRLYDHAISEKKIQKLSQAKVLHYKFDNFAEPTKNQVSPSNRYSESPKTETNGYGFLNQRFNISNLGLSDGDEITGSMKMKVDQARKDAGGSVRFYYWHSSDSDGWMGPSSSTGYNTTSFKRVTKTATIDTSNGQQYINFGVYHYPSGNDTGTSYAKQFQVETKDHATPFVNGTRGGTVTDSSGQGNNASLDRTSTPQHIDSSKVGSGAYEFDGSDDSIDLPPKGIPTGNEVTVSFWSYGGPNQPTNDSILEARDSNNNRVLNIHHPWGNGNIYWDTDDGGTGTDRIYKSADPSDYKGRWTHWTFTKNADTGDQKIYLDGQLWHSGTGKTGVLGTTDYASLGSYADGTSKYWEGKVDDLRLYATALSASEVQEVYEQRASIDSGGNFHTHEVEEPDERTIFTDSTYSVNSSQYNILANHTPEDTDYSEWVESDDTLGNIYLEGWVYLTNSSWYPTTFEFTKNNNDKGVYANFQDGVDSWQQGWNYVFVKADNWSNVSNTPWSNMDRLQLYRNGADSGDSSESIRFKNIRLKKYPDNEPVDDMSLQDGGTLRTNSISEVGPGAESLVGWWPLNGDTRDYAGSANGTNNGASVTSGLGQSAYYFDGDNITIPHSNRLDISGKEITVSLWKTGEDRGNTFHTLLDKENGSTGYIIEHGWGRDNYSSVGSFSFSNSYPNPFGWDWEHVVLRLKEEVVETFVDGVSKNSDTYTGNIGSNNNDIKIGSGWLGKIQDVRVYDRALTAEEVETLYNLTDPRQNQQVVQTDNGLVHTKHEYDERL